MNISGVIYRISCCETDKVYIGSTIVANARKASHFHLLRNGKHHCIHLQRSFTKHKENSFSFEIVEHVKDLIFLHAREQFWIWRFLGKLYNTGPVAGCPSGILRSEEFKARRAEIMTGNTIRRGKVMSDDVRLSISSSLMGNKYRSGILHSIEGRKKISDGLRKAHADGRHPGFGGNRLDTSVLTIEQVREIRTDTRSGPVLAKEYGVTKTCINDIKAYRTWRSLS